MARSNDPNSAGKTQVVMPFEFDGLTPLLTTSKKLNPGAHTLTLVDDRGEEYVRTFTCLSEK